MFDEPVNGLDPEGVVWIRGFLRSLAAEGRAVFVSSHLMSELEGTADHLVVIGRGRLIAPTECQRAPHVDVGQPCESADASSLRGDDRCSPEPERP